MHFSGRQDGWKLREQRRGIAFNGLAGASSARPEIAHPEMQAEGSIQERLSNRWAAKQDATAAAIAKIDQQGARKSQQLIKVILQSECGTRKGPKNCRRL